MIQLVCIVNSLEIQRKPNSLLAFLGNFENIFQQMFTGIIEQTGLVKSITEEGSNKRIEISTDFLKELKVDQSICHNGVCLTVVDINDQFYAVQVVQETLRRSNLGALKPGHHVNLERSLKIGDRLDGHFVYGHVDQTATCISIADLDGSWKFTFKYDSSKNNITVEKGSVCVNGVSLTVVDSATGTFSVAVIPYTYEHTNIKSLTVGSIVNIEFDIIGKYVRSLQD